MATVFHAWVLAVLESMLPAEKMVVAHDWVGIVETVEQRRARYESFANDLEAVVFDPATKLPFAGPMARSQTAALLIGIAAHESGLAPDVDLGPCKRDTPATKLRCDSGHAACVLQVHVTVLQADGRRTTREGWTLEDLFADRQKCFRAGLAAARGSLGMCNAHGDEGRLAAYASGSCDSEAGLKGSRELWAYYQRASGAAVMAKDDVALQDAPR